MKIQPNNWNEFQHYKDRNPTWIKLHKKLLDDFEFHRLPLASRALAPMLWLLASEHQDGVIDADPELLSFRLRCTIKEVEAALSPLIGKGFFNVVQFDSKPLAEPEQDASPENINKILELPTETTLSGKPDDALLEKKNPKAEAHEILAFLNEKVGRNYQPVPANIDLIVARLKEGATAGQCRQVIAKKSREWSGDEHMAEYLRPATLFNRTKFAQYVGELVL